MTDAPKVTSDSPSQRASNVIGAQAALGRAVREKARSLLENAQTPTTPDGYVLVCKGDFEALTQALTEEDAAYV